MSELNYLSTLPSTGGFNYDNCIRNKAMMNNAGFGLKTNVSNMKTGTTICGCVFKDGVALAADTRATGGSIVGDKNCEKIHNLAPNMNCCGAGTAADCDHVTEMISRELDSHRLNTGCESRVQMAAHRLSQHAFKYGGYIGTHLILGGVDVKGPQLMNIDNDGNCYAQCFLTLGSGSLAAMGIMESEYKENMTGDEAKALCVKAIEAGIYHDLGSGSNVDVCLITKGKKEMFRNLKSDNKRIFERPEPFKFKEDRVKIIKEYKHKIEVSSGPMPMDLS